MAELSYGDVQRAVQEAIRNLQINVQRLSSNMGSVSIRTDRIESLEIAIRDLQRSVVTLQNSLLVAAKQPAGRDPRVTQLIHDIYELKVRFVVIERFAQQMSDYFQAKAAEENENRQYRSV